MNSTARARRGDAYGPILFRRSTRISVVASPIWTIRWLLKKSLTVRVGCTLFWKTRTSAHSDPTRRVTGTDTLSTIDSYLGRCETDLDDSLASEKKSDRARRVRFILEDTKISALGPNAVCHGDRYSFPDARNY